MPRDVVRFSDGFGLVGGFVGSCMLFAGIAAFSSIPSKPIFLFPGVFFMCLGGFFVFARRVVEIVPEESSVEISFGILSRPLFVLEPKKTLGELRSLVVIEYRPQSTSGYSTLRQCHAVYLRGGKTSRKMNWIVLKRSADAFAMTKRIRERLDHSDLPVEFARADWRSPPSAADFENDDAIEFEDTGRSDPDC